MSKEVDHLELLEFDGHHAMSALIQALALLQGRTKTRQVSRAAKAKKRDKNELTKCDEDFGSIRDSILYVKGLIRLKHT